MSKTPHTKRKPGRPRKPPGTHKGPNVSTRVTPDIRDWYDKASQLAGFKDRSAWIRATLDAEAQRLCPR